MAGDTSYTQQLLLDEKADGVSPNEATSLRTIRKIKEYAEEYPTVYLPSHDPESGMRLENESLLIAHELEEAGN